MAVVAGGDHHGVAAGISQQGGHIGTGLAEAELAAHVHRADATGGSKGVEAGASLGEGRNEHAADVIARSDHPQQRLAGAESTGSCSRRLSRQSDRALLGIGSTGVFEQDAKRRLVAAEQLVGRRGLLDRKAMGNQRFCAQRPVDARACSTAWKLRCSVQRTKPMG